MGRKGGGAKSDKDQFLFSFSVYFYSNGLKLQNRSLSEIFFFLNVDLIEHNIYMNTAVLIIVKIFLRWRQFPWFLQSALIHGFLNSWFQILQATINKKIVVFRWILIFCGLSGPRHELKLESHY
jgi:hypothetical protein